MRETKKDIPISGFQPLGLDADQSRIAAQHILSAVTGHAMYVPDDASTVQRAEPFHVNLVSVDETVLEAAGLTKKQIDMMRKALDSPLDHKFYDGPDGDRFTFLLDGLERVAGVKEETAKKYAPFFEENGTKGIFKGIKTERHK